MNPVWAEPPSDLALGEGIVHIWFRDLRHETDLALAIESLSPDERVRASRFGSEESRLTYLGSHVFLRQVLAKYLRTEPGLVRFRVDRNGKPHISDPAATAVEFNISHSHFASVCAVTLRANIGIDLELIDPSLCDEAAADLVFSPTEMNHLSSCNGHERCDAFFQCWTRKEAYAKCLGVGMSAALRDIEIGFAHSGGAYEGRTVSTFRCPNRYIASVAIEGSPAAITHWDFSRGNRSAD